MILSDKNPIDTFRLLALLQLLKLELRGMSRSGRSAYTIIKAETGLKGSRQRVYEQFAAQLGKE